MCMSGHITRNGLQVSEGALPMSCYLSSSRVPFVVRNVGTMAIQQDGYPYWVIRQCRWPCTEGLVNEPIFLGETFGRLTTTCKRRKIKTCESE